MASQAYWRNSLFDEFGRAVLIQCFFLRTMERTSDTLDLLSTMIHECPLLGRRLE
jgi:hypothetical protein